MTSYQNVMHCQIIHKDKKKRIRKVLQNLHVYGHIELALQSRKIPKIENDIITDYIEQQL